MNNSPPEKREGTSLHLHTFDSLCAELVSGRGIVVDENGQPFLLGSPVSRAIFKWYIDNKDKWHGKMNRAEDVEAIAKASEKPPPEFPSQIPSSRSASKKIYRLISIKAHRFAGIHRYGDPKTPTDIFEFNFTKDLTLFKGRNGSGKTSILNAIIWCLTGYVYCSQRPPEKVKGSIPIWIAEPSLSNREYDMSPLSPLPQKEVLDSIGKNQLPADTWVELVFQDEETRNEITIKRETRISSRGKLEITEPDVVSQLGINPICLEIGTRMTGLIPYIRTGEGNDIGKAILELTGLSPLKDLADHSKKSQEKLRGQLTDRINANIKEHKSKFDAEKLELKKILDDHSEIRLSQALPLLDDAGCETKIKSIQNEFNQQYQNGFSKAKDILGSEFNSQDSNARRKLSDDVGPATRFCREQIFELESIKRLYQLGSLSDSDLSKADDLLERINSEANSLAELAADPEKSSRLALYAKVAGWIKDSGKSSEKLDKCPVCSSDLEDKIDPVTGKKVSEHVQEMISEDKSFLENTVTQWAKKAEDELNLKLTAPLKAELNKDLPASPVKLIEKGLTENLFTQSYFRATLSALQDKVKSICDEKLMTFPSFQEPSQPALPQEIHQTHLETIIKRLVYAISFSRWASQYKDQIKVSIENIIGNTTSTGEEHSLLYFLGELERIIRAAEPITTAINRISNLEKEQQAVSLEKSKLILYHRAADAIEPLKDLGKFAERQVESLTKALKDETKGWKEKIYKPANVGAPLICETKVSKDGCLEIEAECQGSRASAYHIGNASDLRANLLSFLLAFWGYLLDTQGGLKLLIFDDLQELLDRDNRRHLALAIRKYISEKGQVVITTNDYDFARDLALGCPIADRREIHSTSSCRSMIAAGEFKEYIEERRKQFEDNDNDDKHAQDYLDELRKYLEQRLMDLFTHTETSLPAKPTLSDLLNAIRHRRNQLFDAFKSKVFGTLVDCQALAHDSPLIILLNKAHHGECHEITYGEVDNVKGDCKYVLELVEHAYEEYCHWLNREPLQEVSARPPKPDPIPLPTFEEFPIIEQLAAFSEEGSLLDTVKEKEMFSKEWFNRRAMYKLVSDNFGFSAPEHSNVIVDLSDDYVEDQRLVVALHNDKIYARRLCRDKNRPDLIALFSDRTNPLERPPSLLLPSDEVTLLKVVGVIFESQPFYSRRKPTDEAVLINNCDFQNQIRSIFRVQGKSALPLALEKQKVITGKKLSIAELDSYKGKIVAIKVLEGKENHPNYYLKRIGSSIEGIPHLRSFETIGHGDSLLLQTEKISGDPHSQLPFMESALLVLGILYEETGLSPQL